MLSFQSPPSRLSEVPENEFPPRSPMGALMETVSRCQSLLLRLSNSSINIFLINKGQFTFYPMAQYD
jgi:hypothetical protein